ncbi:MAG: thioredoxin domain-containing protein, partial [Planctomycetota bacterium]
YSTDPDWLVPHFEKMLYDNAQLLRLYAEAFRVTGKEEYAAVVRGTADYVLRDMTDRRGGFHSAEDADSEGVEGKFYVWTAKEIDGILGDPDAEVFKLAYGLPVLNRRLSDKAIARKTKMDVAEVRKALARARTILFEAREKRVRPGLDDKVLTSWNGLMIGALAYAGATLDEPRYVDAARKAAEFVTTALCPVGKLLHRYRDGEAGLDGMLTDYVYLTAGLLDLYEATLEKKWFEIAIGLNVKTLALFTDAEHGGFFFSQGGRKDLIVRQKDLEDGVRPSPTGTAILNLVRIGAMTADATLTKRAEEILRMYAGVLEKSPVAVPTMLAALDRLIGPSRQIVLAGDAKELLKLVHRRHLPRAVILHADLEGLSPLAKGKTEIDGRPAAYVCEDQTCRRPATDAEELARQLAGD